MEAAPFPTPAPVSLHLAVTQDSFKFCEPFQQITEPQEGSRKPSTCGQLVRSMGGPAFGTSGG